MKITEANFSIVDVGKGSVYYYNLEEVVRDFEETDTEFPNRLEDLESYRILTRKCDCDFTDLTSVTQFLKSDTAKGSYLYFDSDAFIDLFLKNGTVNTNFQFSTAFSKEAYFIFDDANQIMKDQGFDWNKKEEAGSFDIENVGFAVYDPVEDIFYSTWDEYFKPNDTYIYSSQELVDVIQQNNISGKEDE